jgi:5'-3' exonuclease
VHLSRRIERPKTRRKIERFERETPEQFEKRAARIAELEIELGIM